MFKEYRWMLWDGHNPVPAIGDVVYRYVVAAITYVSGWTFAAWVAL